MKKNVIATVEEVEHEQQALLWLRIVCIHLLNPRYYRFRARPILDQHQGLLCAIAY